MELIIIIIIEIITLLIIISFFVVVVVEMLHFYHSINIIPRNILLLPHTDLPDARLLDCLYFFIHFHFVYGHMHTLLHYY